MKRIFIIGTPRSGTTLVQSLIRVHPQVYTFPETHFFSKIISRKKYKKYIQWIHKEKIRYLVDFLISNNYYPDINANFKPGLKYIPSLIKKLLTILDEIAVLNNYHIWVEKTPMHLYYIDKIKQVDSSALFIHIIRNGLDNVASLYQVGQKYPYAFHFQSIDACLIRYMKEYEISQRYIGQENHFHLIYDDLVESPEKIIDNLFNFLSLERPNNLFEDFNKNTYDFIQNHEKWKKHNKQGIYKSSKAREVFTQQEIAYIQNTLKNYTLDIFR